MGHISNIIGVIDGTHIAFVPACQNEQVFRNRKTFQSMTVQMLCLADKYISHVNVKYPESVHDAFVLRNSSIPNVMGQLQRHRVWLIGVSGYPNLSWLLTPVRNARTRAEERYDEAHGRTRRIIERTFGPLKEEEAGDVRAAAVDPVDSEDEEVEDEDNRTSVIRQYFQ
ncbi:hypothetical protein NDU88_001868 [Pleurodeles waltl]|uniref:DDE Tnp4 domain-containing protein n=1 Tax=Pleurodeles waltl TaxID=8319 RepID=A0AAV7UVJ3_PLEWA|nr:hypothetical protein NDU88_001868 [Pleurodeles waltl]